MAVDVFDCNLEAIEASGVGCRDISDAKLCIQRHAGNDEKHLIVFWVQTNSTGKVAAMAVAHIKQKPV